MTTILDALVGRENVFAGGASTESGTPNSLQDLRESRLEVQAIGGGAWCESLDVSVVPKGIAQECPLQADHPAFVKPYTIDFSDWSELARKLPMETGFLKLTMVPDAAFADPRAWVRDGRPLVRVSDELRACAAICSRPARPASQ